MNHISYFKIENLIKGFNEQVFKQLKAKENTEVA